MINKKKWLFLMLTIFCYPAVAAFSIGNTQWAVNQSRNYISLPRFIGAGAEMIATKRINKDMKHEMFFQIVIFNQCKNKKVKPFNAVVAFESGIEEKKHNVTGFVSCINGSYYMIINSTYNELLKKIFRSNSLVSLYWNIDNKKPSVIFSSHGFDNAFQYLKYIKQ